MHKENGFQPASLCSLFKPFNSYKMSSLYSLKKVIFSRLLRNHQSYKTVIKNFMTMFILSSSLLLSSCFMVGPDFRAPPPPCNETYTENPLPEKTVSTPIKNNKGKSQYFVLCEQIPKDWWVVFHSAELMDLVALGLANSPNIEAAHAALCQAEETMIAYSESAMMPSVTGQAYGGKQRFSASTIGLIDSPSITFNLYSASLNISYNLDIFGALRRQIEALAAQVEYKCFLLEGAYLTLASNIVNTAITEASLREQIQATRDLIGINQKQYELINKQMGLGGVSLSDVLAQRTQLEQVKATLPPLEKSLSIARHNLATLAGVTPSDKCLPNFYLGKMQLPKHLPVSLPSDLVRQRPDIRASEALLHQACAQVGVATANLYPQLTLTGTYGTTSNSVQDLFKNLSNVWSYAGQIMQPIFNGGSLYATRRAAIAGFDLAAAQYRQSVLLGFQNVADSLRAIEVDAKAFKAQAGAEKSAFDALKLVQGRYKLGGVNYLEVLNAEQQYQKARLNRIQAEAARLSDTAALFQALGGGWWNDEAKCSL